MKKLIRAVCAIFAAAAILSSMPVASAASAAENEKAVYNFIVGKMGLNSAAACGIMANISAESRFSPTLECSSTYGLVQWYGSSSINAMKNWCKSNGYEYNTVTGQMSYLHYELKNSYSSVYSYLKKVANTAEGANNAGYYFCYYYEIPANRKTVAANRGNEAANTFFPKYNSVAAGTATSSGTSVTVNAPSISITEKTTSTVEISWSKVKNVDGYQLYRKGPDKSSYTKVATIAASKTVYTDKSLKNKAKYTYKMRSYRKVDGKNKYSSYSATKTVKVGVHYKTTVTTTAAVNLRKGAGTSYAKITTIPNKTKLTVSSTKKASNGVVWYKVTYNSKTGYFCGTYGKKAMSAVTLDALNIRKGAGTSYAKVTTIPKGKRITVTSVSTGNKNWYKVSYTTGGKTYKGYVACRYLSD